MNKQSEEIMNARKKLENAHILIVDGDRHMLILLKDILFKMGFANITAVRKSCEALQVFQEKEVNILLAEWNTRPLDGVRLVQEIRRNELAKVALVPTILMSENSTEEAVKYARDCGVTEFLAKPYTVRSLYNRMEHIIDFPREFIVSDEYIGPDRRRGKRKEDYVQQHEERRKVVPTEYGLSSKIKRRYKSPVKIMAGKALRRKMQLPRSLREVIVPEILAEAQQAIDAMRGESLQWIAEDIKKINRLLYKLTKGEEPKAASLMQRQLLKLKSHAGTFDYHHIEEVAENLFQFLTVSFIFGSARHHIAVQKHVEVLQVMLAKCAHESDDVWANRLISGLDELVESIQYHGLSRGREEYVVRMRV
ncbi:MAG: response regulator [Rickettsiales bacterium]|nr:response regulator [Rickettsiales bacterium]